MNYKKLDIYIIKKFLGTFFYAIILLFVIIILFDISEKLDDFVEKKAPLFDIIFVYYLNFIPYFANLFSPLFAFIAVIFFTSKMASDTEIVAILSSGISFKRLIRPYIYSAVFLALLSFVLSNFVIPHANKRRFEFELKYIKSARRSKDMNIHMQISPGNYIYAKHFNNESNIAHQFSIERISNDSLVYKLTSEYAKWDTLKSSWKIENYFVRRIDGIKESIKYGASMDTVLNNLKPKDFLEGALDVETMDFFELNNVIAEEKLKGSDNISFLQVEKHKRTAFPFATVVLTIIGVSLSSRKQRGGIGIPLIFGISLSFTFVLFMQVSTTFAIYSNLPAFIAVWIPNIIYGIIGLYLLRIAPK